MDDRDAGIGAREAITERNMRESPLLRLPAELRNTIWHYVIGQHTHSYGAWNFSVYPMAPIEPQLYRRALIRMCRQVHHKTAKLLVNFTLIFDSAASFITRMDDIPDRLRNTVDQVQFHYGRQSTEMLYHLDFGCLRVDLFPNLERFHIAGVFYAGPADNSFERVAMDWVYTEGVGERGKMVKTKVRKLSGD